MNRAAPSAAFRVMLLVMAVACLCADAGGRKHEGKATVVSIDPEAKLLTFKIDDVSAVLSERVLKKGAREYLGWQLSSSEFELCDHKIVKIEQGQIENTKDR